MKRRLLLFIALFLVVTGCAQQSAVKPQQTERIFKDAAIRTEAGITLPIEDIIALESSIKAYWDARRENDWFKAFDYEDPDVIKKEKMTRGGYAASKLGGIEEKEYDVKWIQILAEDKVRTFSMHKVFISLPPVVKEDEIPMKDIWMKKDGKWYRKLVLDPFAEGGADIKVEIKPEMKPMDKKADDAAPKLDEKKETEKPAAK